jgi:division protein 1
VLERIAEDRNQHGFFSEDGDGGSHARDGESWEEGPSGITGGVGAGASVVEEHSPCVRVLEGHSKSVSAQYYEDGVLVSLPSLSSFVIHYGSPRRAALTPR